MDAEFASFAWGFTVASVFSIFVTAISGWIEATVLMGVSLLVGIAIEEAGGSQ